MKALGAVFGSRLRLGAAELVRAAGLRGVRRAELERRRRAPQREPRAGRRTTARSRRDGASAAPTTSRFVGDEMPERHRGRRPAGHVALRQGHRLRAGRARPGSTRSSPTASRRTVGRIALCHLLSAEWRRAGRVHRLSSARRGRFYLVSAGALERHDHDILQQAPARRRQRAVPPGHHAVWRAGARRPALARAAAGAHRRRPLQRRLPLADRQADLVGPAERWTRCASISSASSAGSCTTRSRCRTRMFDLADEGGPARSASSPSASAP